MPTETTDPAELTEQEMTEALLTAGRLDTLTRRAATFLLSKTELPGRRDFAALVELVDERDPENGDARVLAAYTDTDWNALIEQLDAFRLGGGDARLVRLAASYAQGIPVDLRENVAGHGSVHIRYVIEAAIIATGAEDSELYALTEGPGMQRIRDFHASFGS